jgi:hypothetical protein
MLHFSVAGDETAWNFDSVDTALPTLFASLFVNEGEKMLLGVLGEARDECCEGVVGVLFVLLPVVFFPLFLFLADLKKQKFSNEIFK